MEYPNQGCGNTMPDCPAYPISLRTSKISVYLSWDKYFIDLAKKSIHIMEYKYFPYFLKKTYVVGTH